MSNISNGFIANNTAQNGGGFAILSVLPIQTSICTNCTISSVILLVKTSFSLLLKLTPLFLSGNVASSSGGGIFTYFQFNSSPVPKKKAKASRSQESGSTLHRGGEYYLYSRKHTNWEEWQGIEEETEEPTVGYWCENCEITWNMAAYGGGIFYSENREQTFSCGPEVLLQGNVATTFGGGLFIASSSSLSTQMVFPFSFPSFFHDGNGNSNRNTMWIISALLVHLKGVDDWGPVY